MQASLVHCPSIVHTSCRFASIVPLLTGSYINDTSRVPQHMQSQCTTPTPNPTESYHSDMNSKHSLKPELDSHRSSGHACAVASCCVNFISHYHCVCHTLDPSSSLHFVQLTACLQREFAKDIDSVLQNLKIPLWHTFTTQIKDIQLVVE